MARLPQSPAVPPICAIRKPRELEKQGEFDLPIFWRKVVSLVNAVISAVELAKSAFEGVPSPVAAA